MEVSNEYSNAWTWGGSNTKTESYTSTLPVIAGPYSIYQGVAYVKST